MSKRYATINELVSSSNKTLPIKVSKEIRDDIDFMLFKGKMYVRKKVNITYAQYCEYKKLTKLQKLKASEFIEGWPK